MNAAVAVRAGGVRRSAPLLVRRRASKMPTAGDSYGDLHHPPHDPDLQLLLDRNRRWVADKNARDPQYFRKLSAPQHPSVLYIGCSDSRVAANEICGNVGPGNMFIHRNVANLVVASDLNLLSVLEYAVMFLDVKHIVVTGHYDCGGVRSALKNQRLGIIDSWLQNIRDVWRLHQAELDAIEDAEQRHRRLVELNVVEQCLNLYKTGVVQRKRLDTYQDDAAPFAYPRIHGFVFDPAEGILRKQQIDFRRHIRNLRDIYDLYESIDGQGHYMGKRPEDPPAPAK